MRLGHSVVPRLQLFRDQQIVFGLEEISATVNRQLEVVTVSDCVFRASLNTETAEDATTVIDVVNGSVTLVDSGALLGRTGIVRGDDVDTLRRARRRAEITRDTLLAPEFVDVQKMLTAITWLQGHGIIGILDCPLAFRDVRQCHTHALNDGFS